MRGKGRGVGEGGNIGKKAILRVPPSGSDLPDYIFRDGISFRGKSRIYLYSIYLCSFSIKVHYVLQYQYI